MQVPRKIGSHAAVRRIFAVLAILSAVSLAGCRGQGYFAPPGPMAYQQANAVVHDPYPLDDIGPSDLGARPPSYQRSLPEPVRNRLIPDAMPQLGR